MDWNNDGKKDLIAGDTEGNVWLFLNTGTRREPRLAKGKRVEADGKAIKGQRKTYKRVGGQLVVDKVISGNHPLAEVYSKIHMADWDGDGLKDGELILSGTLTIGATHNFGLSAGSLPLGVPTNFHSGELTYELREPDGVVFSVVAERFHRGTLSSRFEDRA